MLRKAMISRIKALLSGKDEDGGADGGVDGLQVSAAALLVEAACLDGHFDDAERAAITGLLEDHFGLDEGEAEELVEAGRAAVADSSQLYAFTRVIKDKYGHDARLQMIEMLWEVAYADGHLHHFEANLVRRICGLIYVSDQESGMARKRVLQRLDRAAAAT